MGFFSFAVKASNPVIYPLISCCDECKSNVTFGCFVSDFFPMPVTVTWVPSVQGGSKTFPALQSSNSIYKLSTDITVPAKNVENKNFQCKAYQSATGKTVTRDISGADVCCPKSLSVKLLSDPNKYQDDHVVLLMCLVEGSGASGSQVQWLKNHDAVNLKQEVYSCAQCSNNKDTFASQVNITASDWDSGAEFSCKVTNPVLKEPVVANISTFCSDCKPLVTVTILPPPLEELYLTHNGSVTCMVTNLKSATGTSFSWSRDQGKSLDVVPGKPEKLQNGLYRLTSTLKICAEEWNSGEKFTCTVTTPELSQPITKSIKKDIAVSVKAPSVYVFPPPAEELARQETATLTCLALGFRPSNILVTWTQQDRPVSPSSFVTFDPKAEGDTYTVYSMLSVPAADWQRGDTFACVVGHDGIPMNFVQKNLDKTIGKPTAVNVSVILADSDVTCY